jgi:protein SCO1
MLKYVWPILALCCFYACEKSGSSTQVPVYNHPDFSPFWLSKKEMNADSIHRVSEFSLTDQLGRTVNNKTLAGKIYVANFMFSVCPSICPRMQENLLAVQKAFAQDPQVMLLSHTVMPWVDSVGQLRRYGQKMGIDPEKWRLLTGPTSKIYTLARQSYFAEEEIGYARDSSTFLHTEHVLLVDGKGRLRGVYNGTLGLEVERLIEDVRMLRGDGR